jgi:hypothetical protein
LITSAAEALVERRGFIAALEALRHPKSNQGHFWLQQKSPLLAKPARSGAPFFVQCFCSSVSFCSSASFVPVFFVPAKS